MLGANDGILSTASLVLGVAASGASGTAIITAGIAGMVAGALSMAAGEYVSVSSQRDAEQADIHLEERELRRNPQGELRELAVIYEQRGLPPALASEVALTLSRGGALRAHTRDELGLDELRLARPMQAAWTSALQEEVEVKLGCQRPPDVEELAQALGTLQLAIVVSVRRVETHRADIQQKLGHSTRAELVRYALDHGLLDDG